MAVFKVAWRITVCSFYTFFWQEQVLYMGGFGSGRWHRGGSKRLVEHALGLDVNFLARRKLLIRDCWTNIRWSQGPVQFAWARICLGIDPERPILFVEVHRPGYENPDDEEFGIHVELTPQHFGGFRRWLRCCLCGRRAAKLYLPQNEYNFACRECHALTYWSAKNAHQVERARAAIDRAYALLSNQRHPHG